MMKFIALLLMLAAAFGAGYVTASKDKEKVGRLLETAKSELQSKVSLLENEAHTLRYRMHLTTARDHLISAQNDILEKNFGKAKDDLASAQKELQTAAKMGSKDNAERLLGLVQSLDGAGEILARSDPRAKVKLESVKGDLDRLIEKS